MNTHTPPMSNSILKNILDDGASSQPRQEMHINKFRKGSENINESPGGD
jgi:hypothetical protein